MNPEIERKIDSEIASLLQEIKGVRRTIHQNPELSGKEYKTAHYLFTLLKEKGFSPKYHLKKTAVSLTLNNGRGKKIVLRADTDALPITEQNGIAYRSQNEGVMHACGHDMHSAILLGAVLALWKLRQYWRGTIVCLFQPSEEQEPGGAYWLIKEGVFPRDADAVFGLHVNPDYTTGSIALKKKYDFAGVTLFDALIRGRGAHGASPEKSIDPIVCAAAMIMSLQTVVSRECPAVETAVVTVGSLHAGVRRNIIPDTAQFQGTIRYHTEKVQQLLVGSIGKKLKKTAESFGADVELRFEKSYPPGYNNEQLTDKAKNVFREYFGESRVIKREVPSMYAEDFSRYQEIVPGLYIHLGVKPPQKRTMEGIHSPRFLPDESAIKTGMEAHVVFALGMLGEKAP